MLIPPRSPFSLLHPFGPPIFFFFPRRPGQGILPHEDGPLYQPTVLILSLSAPAVLRFWRKAAGEGAQDRGTGEGRARVAGGSEGGREQGAGGSAGASPGPSGAPQAAGTLEGNGDLRVEATSGLPPVNGRADDARGLREMSVSCEGRGPSGAEGGPPRAASPTSSVADSITSSMTSSSAAFAAEYERRGPPALSALVPPRALLLFSGEVIGG